MKERIKSLERFYWKNYTRKFIDGGSFGDVFRISQRRIIKIFTDDLSLKDLYFWAKDEVDGAKYFKNGLPVLKIVKVFYLGKLRIGLIKRYIPYEIPYWAQDSIPINKYDKLDFCWYQYRKDSRGKIYRVDTQYKQLKEMFKNENR